MRVLQVLDCYYPHYDGPVNCVINIAKVLNEKGLAEVELLVPSYPQIMEEEGVKSYRCKSVKATEGYRMSVPFFDRSIKKLIKNGGFDVIHVHSPFTLGKYAVKMAKKYNIPVCFSMHTQYKSDFERKLKSKALQKFMMNYIMKVINNSDHILAVSNGARETLKDYGCTHEDIAVVRNGTDMKPIKQDKSLTDEIVEKYGLKGCFTFLTVGRLVENKNIDFSLNVLSKIKNAGINNFKFLIVGAGPYLKDLENKVETLGLKENVVFTGKIMDRKYLAHVYAVSDLFLFPSVFDTCGIVALEAAVNSLPSVMVENTCASELIKSGENGLALPEDADIWAEEIMALMKDKSRLKLIKKNVVETLYIPWEKAILEYFDYYEKVCKESKK